MIQAKLIDHNVGEKLIDSKIENLHLTNKTIIKSVSDSQEEILNNIMTLYCKDGFELDPTFSKGNFYKNITEPKLKFDIEPKRDDVIKADCRKLPIDANSVNSIVFDPPFLASSSKRAGIIRDRFTMFPTIPKLWDFYHESLIEFYRILKTNGILVFKCQDTIENSKQYLSYVEIIMQCLKIGFYPKDVFILTVKNRIIGKTHHKQQHARKYHSYFIVLIKQQSPIKYSGVSI